jgi:hypothetical protein
VGGDVVAAVYFFRAGAVEVDRDRWGGSGVTYPVDAAVAGQYRGGAVLGTPVELPDLPQAGVLGYGAVVQAVVAFF